MAWSEQEIDEVLEETIRTLRGSADTEGGMYLTLAAAELAKENMNVLGDLAIEHVNHRDNPGHTESRAEIPGTGMAFTVVDRRALADDGVAYSATFVDVVESATKTAGSVDDGGTTFPPLRLV